MSAHSNRRRFMRYLLWSRPDDFRGMLHRERIATESVYTFSQGGCSFLARRKLDSGDPSQAVESVFLFRPYSEHAFSIRGQVLYVRPITLDGETFYLHGLEFDSDQEDQLIPVVGCLELMRQRNEVPLQQ